MTLQTDLMGGGSIPAQAAVLLSTNTINDAPTRSLAVGLTATGTVLADAFQLTTFNSNFSTVAAGTGCKLITNWPIGQMGIVYNGGANSLKVFPHISTGTINGGSAGVAVTMVAATANLIMRHSALDWGVYVLTKQT